MGNVFILCDDAKKVTAGVDGTYGDVHMFGFESGVPLTQNKSINDKEKETLYSLIGLVILNDRSMNLNSEMTSTIKSVIKTLSFRIQESNVEAAVWCKQIYGYSRKQLARKRICLCH